MDKDGDFGILSMIKTVQMNGEYILVQKEYVKGALTRGAV